MTRNYENVVSHCVRSAMLTFREHAEAMRTAAIEVDMQGGELFTRDAAVSLSEEFARYAKDAEDLLTALEEGYVQLVELPTNTNEQFCSGRIVLHQQGSNRATAHFVIEHDDACPVHEVAR